MGANGDVVLLLKMRGEMQDPVRRDAVRSNDKRIRKKEEDARGSLGDPGSK